MGDDGGNPKEQRPGGSGPNPWARALGYVESDGPEVDTFEDPAEHDPFDDLVGSGGGEAAFSKEDAGSRKGNFVVPFGLPGSGKTTFLACLFKFIDEAQNLSHRLVVPEPGQGKVKNYAGQAMLNRWQEVFNKGRFLGATPVGADAIRELTYEVTPLKGQRTMLGFSVVEVSGEDLVRVVAREGRPPRLPDAIAALFQNDGIRAMIVLVVHPDQIDNDLLFNNLFIWLNENARDRLKDFSLAILIANPDLALKRLHKRLPDTRVSDRLSGDLLKVYLKEFAPKTHSIYSSWRKESRAILPFRVGEIQTSRQGDETYEQIKLFDKTNSRQFFRWMYRQFTRRELGDGFIQRLFRWLNG